MSLDAACASETLVRRAQHPGVVPVTFTADGVDEVLPVDAECLTQSVLTVAEVAAVGIVVATTLDDLHHVGVAHGNLTCDAVLIGTHGRPIVRDLRRLLPVEASSTQGGAASAAVADARALGRVLLEVMARCAPAEIALALDGPRARRWRVRWRGSDSPVRTIHTIATKAAEGTITCAEVARQLQREVPGARLPARSRVASPASDPTAAVTAPSHPADDSSAPLPATDREQLEAGTGRSGPRPRRTLVRLLVASAGALAGLACIAAGLTAGAPRPRLHPGPVAASPAPCPAEAPQCTPPLRYEGGVLRTATASFEVGRQGDVAAIGRWGCGPSRLALLQPDRGEVWLFPSWAAAGRPVSARLVERVAQARTLTVGHHGACDDLVVGRDDASALAVPAEALR